VTAGFVAHAVDQRANVPRAADSLAMWVMIGMAAALAAVSKNARTKQPETAAGSSGADQSEGQNPSIAGMASPVIAVIVIAIIAGVTILANAGHMMADRATATLQIDMLRGALVSDFSETAAEPRGWQVT
jgi:hypothetical protein